MPAQVSCGKAFGLRHRGVLSFPLYAKALPLSLNTLQFLESQMTDACWSAGHTNRCCGEEVTTPRAIYNPVPVDLQLWALRTPTASAIC